MFLNMAMCTNASGTHHRTWVELTMKFIVVKSMIHVVNAILCVVHKVLLPHITLSLIYGVYYTAECSD